MNTHIKVKILFIFDCTIFIIFLFYYYRRELNMQLRNWKKAQPKRKKTNKRELEAYIDAIDIL